MENKKYLDKVLDHLVRSTDIDHENNKLSSPFLSNTFDNPSMVLPFSIFTFNKYCRRQFGLTDEEIKYVWKEYEDIITDEIKNG